MITYVCNSDFGKHGAIGFRTYHAAKEALNRDYLDNIICRGNKTDMKVSKYKGRMLCLIRSGVQQYIVPNYKAHEINRRLFERFAIKQLPEEMSGQYLHVYDYLPRVMQEAKKRGAKVVLDTQMGSCLVGREVLKEDYAYYGLQHSGMSDELMAVTMADYIVCANEFVYETFKRLGIQDNVLRIVKHGVDVEKYKPVEKPIRKPKFLYAGLVEPRKGIRYLLDAFRDLDAELIIAGRVNKIMQGKMDIPENVKFVGHVDLLPYFKECDVFVFPSLFESTAKVILEAMAAGLPVITTANAGPIHKDGEGGFIVPIKNSVALRDKINYFLKNPEKVKEMGAEAAKKVSSRSWEQYGKDVCNLYEQVIEDEI